MKALQLTMYILIVIMLGNAGVHSFNHWQFWAIMVCVVVIDVISMRSREGIELKKEAGVAPGLRDGSLDNTERDLDQSSHIIATLNETYGDLTEDDKVDIQRICTKLEADESLQIMLKAYIQHEAKVYYFNQVLDRLLQEFISTKLILHRKLTEPKINEILKLEWFEVLAKEVGNK